MKKCSDCKQNKELTLFSKNKSAKDGLCNVCKKCYSIRKTANYLVNSDLIKKRVMLAYEIRKNKGLKRYGNKDIVKECKKRYYIKHKERINKDKYEKKKKRLKNDYFFKFKENLRCLILMSFKNKYLKKNTKTTNIIGCDFNSLLEHLKLSFINNYKRELDSSDKVHIDHIIPLSTAKTEEDVIKLNHFSNLQYLLVKDNLKKSNKVIIGK